MTGAPTQAAHAFLDKQAGGRCRSAREYALHTGLLIALLACIFPGVFLHGERITAAGLLYESRPWSEYAPAGYDGPQNPLMTDIVTAFTPYYAVTQEALWSGEWPLWNPYEMGGMPLLANYQSAVFYPPRLLHAFLELHLATTLYVLLKLWLCGMTAYVCGRALGWRTGVARFYSLAWMLSSYALVWSYWPLTDVAVWAPVVFLGIESVLGGRYRRGFFVLSLGGACFCWPDTRKRRSPLASACRSISWGA